MRATSVGHLDVLWRETPNFKFPYYKNEGCYQTENPQKEMYLGGTYMEIYMTRSREQRIAPYSDGGFWWAYQLYDSKFPTPLKKQNFRQLTYRNKRWIHTNWRNERLIMNTLSRVIFGNLERFETLWRSMPKGKLEGFWLARLNINNIRIWPKKITDTPEITYAKFGNLNLKLPLWSNSQYLFVTFS